MAKLMAEDAEDLETIAALLQDSLLRACDVDYNRRRRTLSFLVNRYHWESKEPMRGHSVVRLHGVTKAMRRSWPETKAAVLEILHIEGDDDLIEIFFAGGTAVRCRVECIDMLMEDVGEPWPTDHRPDHEDDDEPVDVEDTGEAAAGAR